MNCLTHVTTQMISFPFISHRHVELRPSPLVRSGCCLLKQKKVAAAATDGPTVVASNKSTTVDGKGMSWFHEMESEVREYELDQFGVVNNAIYNNYCEYATYKLFDLIGFEADTKLALAELSAKYMSSLKRKDKYLLKVRIYDYSLSRMYTEYEILKLPNHEPIARGRGTLVLIDERLRPCRIPAYMISKFNQFLLTYSKNT